MSQLNYLGTRGYVIYKSNINKKEINEIKTELTVSPYIADGYGAKPIEFKNYLESTNKLYLPKSYGLHKFGIPAINKLEEGIDINIKFTGILRPLQVDAVKSVLDSCKDPSKMGGLLCLQCGEGKCLGIDTKIIMYEGCIKKVQDIEIGDILMGDDSKPRNVLSICHGKELMYKIIPDKGEPYIVNESHILSLKNPIVSLGGLINYQIIDISVREYLKLPLLYQEKLVGYKVPIEFSTKSVDFDPYIIGIAVQNNKHIPMLYKCNSKGIRLQVLAGIIDSNGYLEIESNTFEISFTSEKLIDDIIFLVRSLGFVCYKTWIYPYFKIYISGEGLETIPTQILQKKAIKMKEIKNTLVYKFHIEKCKKDDYYGFEIDGNRRFILGDFTVTHNTISAIHMICVLAKKTLIIVHKEFLLQQWKERILEFAPSAKIGLIKAKIIDIENKDIVLAMLQSVSMKEYEESVFKDFGNVIFDECHHLGAEVFSQALRKVTFKYSIGLTATPKRADGLTKVFTWFLGDIAYTSKKRKDNVGVHLKKYYSDNLDYSKIHTLYNNKPNMAKMINNICEYEPRVEFIINEILIILNKEPGRKCLFLSDRRNHLHSIKYLLDTKKNNGTQIESGYYYGGLKEYQLKETEAKQIILATFQMAKEGLDIKGLDTLVLLSPKSDIIQICGRILRDKPEDRKYIPLILDIVDDFSLFKNQGKKRYTYYKKCKYDIIDNDNLFIEKKNISKKTCIIQEQEDSN